MRLQILVLMLRSLGVKLIRCRPAVANAKAGSTSFHLADTSSSPPDALRLSSAPTADLTHHYFDMAYVGAPKQCSEKDTTCKLLQHEMRFDRELLPDEENQYKYVVDVDANYASGKFKRVMCVSDTASFPPVLALARSLQQGPADHEGRTGARVRSSSSRQYSPSGGPSESCRYGRLCARVSQ